MGFPSPVTVAVRGVGAAVDRLDRILSSLETLGGSMASIERDMRLMRQDIQAAVDGIDALRGDVRQLDASVGGIRDTTRALEEHVIELRGSLKRIDSLVPRLGRRSRQQQPQPSL